MIGICFLREASQIVVGPDRRAGKWGVVQSGHGPTVSDVYSVGVVQVLLPAFAVPATKKASGRAMAVSTWRSDSRGVMTPGMSEAAANGKARAGCPG